MAKDKKPMRTLEEVLESLKAAEKEYAKKCLEYGITEKVSRKKKQENGQEVIENGESGAQDNLENHDDIQEISVEEAIDSNSIQNNGNNSETQKESM